MLGAASLAAGESWAPGWLRVLEHLACCRVPEGHAAWAADLQLPGC